MAKLLQTFSLNSAFLILSNASTTQLDEDEIVSSSSQDRTDLGLET